MFLKTCFLFLVSCFIFLWITPRLAKPVFAALGAQDLHIVSQTCTADNRVNVGFAWIAQAQGDWFKTDAQYLDISTIDNTFSDPSKYLGAVNPPYPLSNLYDTSSGGSIGPLDPGKLHYWRINTHNQYQTNPAGWYPTLGPAFTTITCSGSPTLWKLGTPTMSGCTATFSITAPDGTTGAGHDSTLGVSATPYYISPVIPDTSPTVSYTATQSGSLTAVLLLYTAEISNKVTFTAPPNCVSWNNPGAPAPPFNIMSVFQPAKRFGSFGQLASDFLLILVSLAAGLALFFIVLSGIKLATSSGDEKKLASAKGTLTYAIIGIAVIILAFVVVRILQYFLQSSVPIT